MNNHTPEAREANDAPPASEPVIAVDNVTKSFHSANTGIEMVALRDISLTVGEQEFVTLLGPSGCGKSTLLRLVDGLLKPDAGRVLVFGAPPKPGPDIGFAFQSFRLIPWATAQANVEFALQNVGLNRAERAERALNHLDRVGLLKFKNAYPDELSGGMKQRVALARAFASEPRVLLMDEPFASIDAQARELMQVELMRIWAERHSTTLFVTHSVDEAIVLSDKVVLMGPRPGRVVEVVDVRLDRPRWMYDARADPHYVELRSYLSNRMRELVLSDPASEFFGRMPSSMSPSS